MIVYEMPDGNLAQMYIHNGEKFVPVETINAVSITKGKWTDAIITADNLYDRLYDRRGMLSSMHGYVCDCCQNFSVARYNYCPNCGARMDKEV